jgi:uncharacterized pyridoxamine 5'-phosphate oxidase family protein
MNKLTSSQMWQTKDRTKDQIQFSSFAINKSTFSQISQTKDQGPDPTEFLCNEYIVFFSNLADQRPRTRSNSVPMQPTNQLLLKCCRPKTKDQIQFSSIAMHKSTSSQMWQTKDQGPDPIQFLSNEKIVFFLNLADQRPTTRSNSVPLR